jgi:dethiobiotin synthetase
MTRKAQGAPRGVFVAGTDTGVGKTRFAADLVAAAAGAGLPVSVMKPVAAGAIRLHAADATSAGLRNDDALALIAACGQPLGYDVVNPYCFESPISPHIAADDAGITVDISLIAEMAARLGARGEWLVAEGAGGWLTPIGPRLHMADVALALGLPVVLVVGMRLGCLNHAALTLREIRRSGLPFAGWVGNQIEAGMARVPENLQALEQAFGEPPLAVLPFLPPESLRRETASAALARLASSRA